MHYTCPHTQMYGQSNKLFTYFQQTLKVGDENIEDKYGIKP